MKPRIRHLFVGLSLAVILLAALAIANASAQMVKPSPGGLVLPADYQNWRLIAVSHRTDKGHMRAILGNDTAIQAVRSGKLNPWPDGSILAKIAWKQSESSTWPSAIVPAEFVQVELMVKNASKYAATGGWEFARWVGKDLTPYGNNLTSAQECFVCHQPQKENDFVFTHPVQWP